MRVTARFVPRGVKESDARKRKFAVLGAESSIFGATKAASRRTYAASSVSFLLRSPVSRSVPRKRRGRRRKDRNVLVAG